MLFGDCLFDRNKEQSFLFSVKNGDWVERRGIDLEREREGGFQIYVTGDQETG